MDTLLSAFTHMKETSIMLATSALLLLVMTSQGEGTIFTSSAKIKELATFEQPLLDSLHTYVSAEYEKLRVLSGFLADRSKSTRGDSLLEHAEHPNSAYKLIKLFARDWQNIVKDNPVFAKMIADTKTALPTKDDLAGARSALVRLQSVYGLNVRDMYKGDYLGYQGPPLKITDATEIAQESFTAGDLSECLAWLQLMAEELQEQEAREGRTERSKELTAFTLGLQGRVYGYFKNPQKARELYNQASAVYPSSPEVIALNTELANPPRFNPAPGKFRDSFRQLCARDPNQRVTELRPYHICRYRQRLYQRYKEEVLSVSPYAILVYDVITNKEIEDMKDAAMKNLIVGRIGGNQRSIGYNIRTSSLGWVWDGDSATAARLSQRVKAITGLETSHSFPDRPVSAEPFQVVNYGLGGHYDVHLDSDSSIDGDNTVHPGAGPRLATFMFYLSDVVKGGNTVFPAAGISVTPIKGMALFWYNYAPALSETDPLTHHAGCPVIVGHKWVANKWIRVYGNMQRRPCGLSPNSTQLDIEPYRLLK